MAKSKKKKGTFFGTNKQQRKTSLLNRLFGSMTAKFRKYIFYGSILLLVVVLIFAVYTIISGNINSGNKDELLTDARQNFLLGRIDQAILDYHKASNVAPDDKNLQREMTMVKIRNNVPLKASLENAAAAAMPVISSDSNSIIANANLAFIYAALSELDKCYQYALKVRTLAEDQKSDAGRLAAVNIFISYYTQLDQHDSAKIYSKQLLKLAETLSDTFSIKIAYSSWADAALQLGELEEAREALQKMEELKNGNSLLSDYAQLGMAEYYLKKEMYDSCSAISQFLLDKHQQKGSLLVRTSAESLLGQLETSKGNYNEAVELLQTSQRGWRFLRMYSYFTNNLNDLADAYFKNKDYYNARKFYLAAGKIAERFGFTAKNKYDVNLNLRFLKLLSSDDYLQSGQDGSKFAEQL